MSPAMRAAVLLALVAALFVVGQVVLPGFAAPSQIANQLKIAAFLGLFGLSQTLVIASGGQGLDLSVGAVATLGGIVGTALFAGQDNLTPLGMAAAVGAGATAGVLNGITIVILGIPPLVATLALASMIDGGLILVVSLFHPSNAATTTLVDLAGRTTAAVPNIAFVWAVISMVALWFLWSGLGRRLCATGSNPVTAYLSGTNIKVVRIVAYGLSGCLAGFGGILLTGYVSQAFLGIGNPYILISVVVAVIGGVALEGGRAPYLGVVCAALLMTVLMSLLTAAQIGEAGRQLVLGATLLTYLMLDRVLKLM
jgi:ribose transport system permease protein